MGAAHQKDQDMIETWDFQPPPLLQRGAGNGVDDGLCVHDKVSIESRRYQVQRAPFRIGLANNLHYNTELQW